MFFSTMSKDFLASLCSAYLLNLDIQRHNFSWRYKKQCNVLVKMREKESLEYIGECIFEH